MKAGLKLLGERSAAPTEALTLGRFSAFLRTFYEDPASIEVTSDYVGIEWSPDGVCANPPGESSAHSYEVSWFSPSDWTLESDLFLYDGNCDEVYSNEVAHFKNTLFCVPVISTYISNHTNQIKGFPDATGEYLSVSEKAGDLRGLAQREHRVRGRARLGRVRRYLRVAPHRGGNHGHGWEPKEEPYGKAPKEGEGCEQGRHCAASRTGEPGVLSRQGDQASHCRDSQQR